MKSYKIILAGTITSLEKDGYVSFGPPLRSIVSYENDETALRMNEQFIKPGLSLIIRPHHNDEAGLTHEYRSYDGKPFERINFTR